MNEKQITSNALALIHRALAIQANESLSYKNVDDRMTALHIMFNVTDSVLGIAGTAVHAKRAALWRARLHVRTCDACKAQVHDAHMVLCESSIGDVFAFCETCAIESGLADVCPQCGLAYGHDDFVSFIPPYLSTSALHGTDIDALMTYACVDCFVGRPTTR